jgi:hypothetical protein
MRHTHRIFGLIAASLLSSAVLYGQSARVIYDRVSIALERWGCREQQLYAQSNGAHHSHGTRCSARLAVIRVRLQDFTGGDSFGRLALVAGNGFWTQGIRVPAA